MIKKSLVFSRGEFSVVSNVSHCPIEPKLGENVKSVKVRIKKQNINDIARRIDQLEHKRELLFQYVRRHGDSFLFKAELKRYVCLEARLEDATCRIFSFWCMRTTAKVIISVYQFQEKFQM